MRRGDRERRGLQAERTELAWVRTGLAAAALTALTTHMAGGLSAQVLAATAAGVVTVIAVTAGALRARALRAHPEPAPAPPSSFALLTAAVVLAGMVTLALVVT